MIGGLTDDPKHARELADGITKTVDAQLVLGGDLEGYLKGTPEHRLMD